MRSVFMITGFLESGKSEFINYTLGQPYFQLPGGGKTLLILCEEGEVEYEKELLEASHTVVELIENEEDFNPDFLQELDKKHKPERIVIEFNGMWNCKNIKFPWFWKMEQQITTIDASTFAMYYSNMKSLLAEMVRKSEMIIFNRCDGLEDELAGYRRNIKAVNQKAEIIFEGSKGEVSLAEDLPYDITQSKLKLDDYGYAVFYIDAMDNIDRYVGKELTFLAQVMKPKNFDDSHFVPGRMAMTCCADDIQFLGYICEYDGASKLKEKDWITVTATVTKQVRKEYDNRPGVVFKAVKVEPAKTPAPKDQVIGFS